MPTGLLCEGVDRSDEIVMGGVTDAVKNFVWHKRGTSKVFGEKFTKDLNSHLPPPFVKLFPKHLVVLGGFVWFHG